MPRDTSAHYIDGAREVPRRTVSKTMSDAAYCERIVFRHARTFALASRLLPREKRRGVYAVYAFCRAADDLVDLAMNESQPASARERLAAYERVATYRDVRAVDDPISRELVWAMDRYSIPTDPFLSLLGGVARDLEPSTYPTWSDLQGYCHAVASSVGEMCTAVFGVPGERANFERALEHARVLGLAMQLTNILRDVGEDARRGRCYLPDEDLARFSIERGAILAGEALSRRDAWERLIAFEIARARDLYIEALPGIALLSADAQRCASACTAGYAAILEVIEQNDFDTITRRAVVPPTIRARVLLRSWLGMAPVVTSRPEPADAEGASAAAA
jgi:15-cis-phytoene synthase